MTRLSRRPQIKSTFLLVVAVLAFRCSVPSQQQPTNPALGAKESSPRAPDRLPASSQGYPEARFEAASRTILSVPPDAFLQLPDGVISILRSRGCTIPQPSASGPPRNVIHGDFFSAGQTGWAALCSSAGFSSILVFRDDLDADPQELAKSEDKNYLQDFGTGEIGYSREITTVGEEFITTHYRAHGGPKPPPIDHHGIDDAFLEKASITHYWYDGKWLRLQGAD